MLKSMKRFAEDGEVLHEIWKAVPYASPRFSEPSSLSLMQQRRLDELADFVATLRYGESTRARFGMRFSTNRICLGFFRQRQF